MFENWSTTKWVAVITALVSLYLIYKNFRLLLILGVILIVISMIPDKTV